MMFWDIFGVAFFFLFTFAIIYGFCHWCIENEKAADEMYRSAKEAKDRGDHDLAKARFSAAQQIADKRHPFS